jgi:hypothetical protein
MDDSRRTMRGNYRSKEADCQDGVIHPIRGLTLAFQVNTYFC